MVKTSTSTLLLFGPAKKKKNDDNEIEAWMSQCPIAQCMLRNDCTELATILMQNLPQTPHSITDVKIEKSVGESFTGGRSTPIYFIECLVHRSTSNNSTKKKKKRREFVCKLVLMPDDDNDNKDKSSLQLHRKRESYAVETRFYKNQELMKKILEAGLTIPRLIASDNDGTKPNHPICCLLMTNVCSSSSTKFPTITHHPKFLSVQQAKLALKWIAKWHAIFWGCCNDDTDINYSWKRDLWDRGAFWTSHNINNNNNKTTSTTKVDGIATTWRGTYRYIESKYPEYLTTNTNTATCIKGLGQRIQNAGTAIANFLTTKATCHHLNTVSTLIHGDYKSANLFIAAAADETEENDDDGGSDRVAVVDFQFTGPGVCAEDVAYLLYPDARGDYFDDEDELLHVYHDELITQLVLNMKGGPSTMSYTIFKLYYDLARIDMTRYWIAEKGWVASTEAEVKLVLALEATMNKIDGGTSLKNDDEYEAALSRLVCP